MNTSDIPTEAELEGERQRGAREGRLAAAYRRAFELALEVGKDAEGKRAKALPQAPAPKGAVILSGAAPRAE